MSHLKKINVKKRMFIPEIIFEDQDILVINKPAGLATQGSEKSKKLDLYSLLKEYLDLRDKKPVYLALHHRLDAATSGLILFCKNPKMNKAVSSLFQEKTILKKYLTIVDINSPQSLPLNINDEWVIENKLIEYKFKSFKKAKSSQNGKVAITSFKLKSRDENSALLECTPHTGRLHQIRVHLSEIGLPIQGDFNYNSNYKDSSFKLCAHFLSFPHPRTKKILTLEISPPS